MQGIARLSITNRAVISLLCLVALGAGIFSASSLKQELFPDLSIPQGSVVSTYPGATGESVEAEVTEPLEESLRGVPGVTGISSTSATNSSQITVEWDYQDDPVSMEAQIRQAVARAELPEDVDPTVVVGGLDDLPVLMLAASSDQDPGELATQLEEVAKPTLEEIPGVREAQISGQRAKQIQITARPTDLERLDVQMAQLQELFEGRLNPVPAGDLGTGEDRINVQVGNSLSSAEEISQMRLQGTDGPVVLRDVADVDVVDAEATSFSRVNGEDSLSVSILKTPDANTVQVANAVTAELNRVAADVGGNTHFTTVFNQAPFIEDSIENLATDGALGLVMAVLIILIFLWSGRSTIITAVSIPLSLLLALITLFVTEHTLNLLTLSALTISVGRVVDDSIVVIENINRHRGLVKPSEFGAGVIARAVGEVGTAIASSTLISVAVFLPIAVVGGEAGELFRPFALTSAVALLASLVVALFVVPALAYWFLQPTAKEFAAERAAAAEEAADRAAVDEGAIAESSGEAAGATAWSSADDTTAKRAVEPTNDLVAAQQEKATRMQKGYLPILNWTLRHRLVTLAIAAVIFVGSLAMTPLLRTDFIGSAGEDTISIQQTLPQGTSLEETDAAAREIESVLAEQPGIETYQTTVGGGSGGMLGGGDNSVTYSLTLTEEADPAAISNEVRARFDQMPEAGTFIISAGSGSTGSQDLTVTVSGRDLAQLEEASAELTDRLAQIDGLDDVRSDLSETEPLMQIDVDEQAAADLGMSQASIGMAVNDAVQGTTLGDITTDHGTTEVIMRSQPAVQNIEELRNLELPLTEKQNADAAQALQDEAEAEQDQLTAEQEEKADEQAAEQEQDLRDSRDEAQQDLNDMRSELSDARRAAEQTPVAPVPGAPGAPGAGGMPGADAGAADAQIEQLEEQVTAMEEQVDSLDEQLEDMATQQAEQAEQEERSDYIQQLTEDAQEAKGTPAQLSQVAELSETETAASINRVDGSRSITITATPTGDDLGGISAQVMAAIDDTPLPAGVQASMGGVSEEQGEAFRQLWLAMGVAVAMIYIIMVATFRSMLQPLLLLISIPFAATGAIGILLVTDTALGLPAMIGLLMLIGIVVTNAIVLIDLINDYRRRGSTLDDAVLHGARLRLRPIIMTALATIMGLAPMASGLAGGGIFISQSLALVVIGGLVSSTVLTLILVPVLYHLLERGQEKRRAKRQAKLDGTDQDEEPESRKLADVGLADET